MPSRSHSERLWINRILLSLALSGMAKQRLAQQQRMSHCGSITADFLANRVGSAWHAIKYLDPKESGAVIPILHVNGFKISERTIFGCMDDKELIALFTGYGYQVCIVDDLEDINNELASALEWALGEVRNIQKEARADRPIAKPRWPMMVLRTPKVRHQNLGGWRRTACLPD
jgi:hypothetical protein